MRKEDKGTVIGQLTETLKEYPNFYLTDIEALDAEKTSKLRRECFKREVKLVVVKNNLLKKALENIEGDFSDLNVALKGNTAVMFSQVANAPARLIKDFTKDAKKGVVVKPALKAAYVQESFYVGAENLEALVTSIRNGLVTLLSKRFKRKRDAFSFAGKLGCPSRSLLYRLA